MAMKSATAGAAAGFDSSAMRPDSSSLCLASAPRARDSSARAGGGLTAVLGGAFCGGGFSAGPPEVQAVSQNNVSASNAPGLR